ncbi:hypothetical protein HMPREF1147_0980 [Selenomonas sp. FOBRC9]|nr:hypothetical protein HMPREF1147_0980 [Selenomonas sp. FOBRC9]
MLDSQNTSLPFHFHFYTTIGCVPQRTCPRHLMLSILYDLYI